MSDTLSQEEIDALKDAVKTGEAFDEGAGAAAPVEDSSQVKISSYDFRKPHLISNDQLSSIRLLHETASKTLQASLFTALKTSVEFKLVSVDQVTFSEYILSLSNPTYIASFETEPAIGHCALEISLSLAMSMLDITLGSDGKTVTEDRELTTLENDLFRAPTDIILQELSESWSKLMDVKFNLANQGANPEYCQIHTPETSCLSATFDVHLGEASGIINICYPFGMIQSVLDASESHLLTEGEGGGAEASGRNEMLEAISEAPLEMRAVLGTGTVSAEQLGKLKPGDVLCLDRRVESQVDVYLGKNLSFKARVGQKRGKAAVGITDVCRPVKSMNLSEQ